MGFWDVFPECSEVLVYLQMLRRLPRLLNYSLAYFTLGLRGSRSKGEGVGNLGARKRLREKPLALLVRPKSPFLSLRTPVTQATLHLRPISTDAFLATHVNFNHVNKIEARYKVLRLNVKLSEVLLLRLRAIFHTLPLFYYATVEIDPPDGVLTYP